MKIDNYEEAAKTISLKKIVTIDQLTNMLKCSCITARRFLKKKEALTSINKNARYYTLPDIPKFDENGLWYHRGVSFSKRGNLKQTVIQLIRCSSSGLTADAVEKLVGLSDNSPFLSNFRNAAEVRRKKIISGQYVYFSSLPAVYNKQLKNRTKDVSARISPPEAVIILVEFINNPNITIQKLVMKAASKGVFVKENIVRSFFEQHGIKKNMDTVQ